MQTKETRFKGIFLAQRGRKRLLLTKNQTPGRKFFDEDLIAYQGSELRTWSPNRSKLSAAILNGLKNMPIKEGDIVLYLGSSYGTTCTYVSDIVKEKGFIFALDFAPRVMRELVFISQARNNICPILADANRPGTYKDKVSKADVLYIDVAQRNQAEILIKNADMFLKPKGYAFFAIKARSVDVTKKPEKVFQEEIGKLLKNNFKLIEKINLRPYQKDHVMVLLQYKP
ncbi:fibrillin [Candidatus Woesearchaeota archaeon]|jgi:fibrillarin-like pre-rRNA processing protein|nr:fibrillin [Candidatus Woesearchaeota archaeon]|tara:strand:- start:2915 stop:3598 length:684 start_codon:yes stop_codon:yes gene_type:complete